MSLASQNWSFLVNNCFADQLLEIRCYAIREDCFYMRPTKIQILLDVFLALPGLGSTRLAWVMLAPITYGVAATGSLALSYHSTAATSDV